jgi:hypothetical protein
MGRSAHLATVRDPRRGYWSPEFRAWLTAYERGVRGPELEELDAAAIAAGEQLQPSGSERSLSAIDTIALSLLLAIDEDERRLARDLAERLRDVVDELRAATV